MAYSNNICWRDMFKVTYLGLRLIPTRAAQDELVKYELRIENCKEVLEQGYEARKRSKNTIEKWLDCGDKTYNVVVVKDYNNFFKEEVYVIIHIGKFTRRKK